MRVGFTGTREGLTNHQLAWLVTTFENHTVAGITEVHHGACVGADAAVHAQAIEAGLPIHVWPPVKTNFVAVECLCGADMGVTVHPQMPYLNRDREIVHHTDGLVALPKQDSEPDPNQWGGTWYTVNYAVAKCKPVTICYPNGKLEHRNVEGRQ